MNGITMNFELCPSAEQTKNENHGCRHYYENQYKSAGRRELKLWIDNMYLDHCTLGNHKLDYPNYM